MRIPIVNEQDEIIEYKDRKDVISGDIIRITAIWVTDPDGNILLAQRAFTKKDSPGLWGPAVAGTVEENETYESNAIKEAGEEIGLFNVHLTPLDKILYTSRTGRKFCQFFSLTISIDEKLVIQEDEVAQIKWFSKEDLFSELESNPDKFVYGFTLLKEFLLSIK